jgi:flagellar hook-length control protein FliK
MKKAQAAAEAAALRARADAVRAEQEKKAKIAAEKKAASEKSLFAELFRQSMKSGFFAFGILHTWYCM